MSLCDRDLSLSAFDQERFYWKQTEQLLRTSREKDASKTDGTVWLDRLHTAGQAAHDEHDGHKTNLNDGHGSHKTNLNDGHDGLHLIFFNGLIFRSMSLLSLLVWCFLVWNVC